MISDVFSKFVVGLDLGKVSPFLDFSHFNKLIMDAIVCGMAGSQGPYADSVLKTYRNLAGVQHSTIIGSHEKTSAPGAAFINSYFARNYTFDDVYEPGVIHSGAAVIMSSLALGEWLNSTMREAMEAMIAGYEIGARISKSMNPAHYDRGFHPTGTCNPIAVAASASKLLHLDEAKTMTALRLAADQACGFRQYQLDGNIANSAFHASKASESGILSALLAREGFADPGETVSGKFGLLNCMGGVWREQELTEGLGEKFYFLETSLKPYPSCRYMHGAVDAVAKCAKKNRLNPKDIDKIKIFTFKMGDEEGNRPSPKTIRDAQFSIHYNIAVYLTKGALGIDDFTLEAIQEKEAREWLGKITVFEDEAFTRKYPDEWPFRAEITGKDGRHYVEQVMQPPGSPSNPLDDGEFEKKCRLLLKPILGEGPASVFLEKFGTLDQFTMVADFFDAF